jgi:DNA primase
VGGNSPRFARFILKKTPSFFVVEDKGFFHCFGCGAHGDVIEFVRRHEQLDFAMAVARLASVLADGIPDNGRSTPRPPGSIRALQGNANA